MVEFQVKTTHVSDNEDFIGAEVIIYDNKENVVKKISIVDEEDLQVLTETLENIDDKYIDVSELTGYLANEDKSITINATKLEGKNASYFEKTGHNHNNYSEKPHADTTGENGIGTDTKYGHVKIRNNLTATNNSIGEALAAYQGRILNENISQLNSNTLKNSLHILVGRWSDDAGKYGTKIQLNRGNGIYFQLISDNPNYDYSKCFLSVDINGVTYTFGNGQERTISKNGKSSKLTINLSEGSYMLIALAKGNGEDFYPAYAMKRIIVE